MNETVLVIAAIISALAAVLSAWFSARATRIAQLSLGLAQKQEKDRKPSLDLYLIDSSYKRLKDRRTRVYIIQLSISNRSSMDNSVRRIDLTIEGKKESEGQTKTNIVLSHTSTVASQISNLKRRAFLVPIKVGAYETAEGCALFEVKDELLSGLEIDSYLLTAVDSRGFQSQLEPIVINEARNEKQGMGNDNT